MHLFFFMGWRVYTKVVEVASGVSIRWYWSRDVAGSAEESTHGFVSRSDCEADAIAKGCKPEELESERRVSMSRLFTGPESRRSL